MTKVLFVCTGNICRSPAAHAILEKLSGDRELKITVDSAATQPYHTGEPADLRMQKALEDRGYQSSHLARPVTARDLEDYNFIFAMDRTHERYLRSLATAQGHHSKIALMLDYASEFGTDVPDPYYGGSDGFYKVIEMLEVAIHNWLRSQRL